ncbi:MAG: hypothetical protein HOM03_14985 [Marinovum sp.]|jgi:hypothetical protein|nr:hypothetical protein [Marinovum sp.]
MNAKEAFVVIAFDKLVYSLKPEITGMLQGCRRDLKVNNSRFPFDPENTFSFTTPDTAFAASALEINWLKYGSNQRGSG